MNKNKVVVIDWTKDERREKPLSKFTETIAEKIIKILQPHFIEPLILEKYRGSFHVCKMEKHKWCIFSFNKKIKILWILIPDVNEQQTLSCFLEKDYHSFKEIILRELVSLTKNKINKIRIHLWK